MDGNTGQPPPRTCTPHVAVFSVFEFPLHRSLVLEKWHSVAQIFFRRFTFQLTKHKPDVFSIVGRTVWL